MKTRNVILGLCAVALAVGSAFASMNLATLYVKVDTKASQGVGCIDQTAVCIPFTATCNGGNFTCFATVNSSALPAGTTAPIRNIVCSILTDRKSVV